MRNLGIRFTYIDDPTAVMAILIAAIVLSLVIYGRSFRSGRPWLVAVLAALRFGAIAAAIVLILRPVVSFDRLVKGEGRVAVLIDTSRSMAVEDSVLGERRFDSAHRIATGDAVARLSDLFHVEHFAFSGPESIRGWSPSALSGGSTPSSAAASPDTRNAPARTAEGLAPDGSTTDLTAAWKSIPSGAGRLEAIVLLSDGRDQGKLRAALSSGGGLPGEALPPVPVHAVGIGSGGVRSSDVGWIGIDAERKALRGNRVPLRCRLAVRGRRSAAAVLILRRVPGPSESRAAASATVADARPGGEAVERKQVRLVEGWNDVDWSVVPDRAGLITYEVVVDPGPGDAIPENDTTHFILEVTDRQLQVLFVEGRARWQYKFVRRAIDRDPSMNFTGLVHLGEGRVLEQGKPPLQLDGRLPSREGLRAFDVLILGNVAASDLAPGDLDRVRAWVEEDGGGLLWSGGPECWSALAASEIGSVLPLSPGSTERVEGEMRIVPPLVALDHPITRGLDAFFSPSAKESPFLLAEAFDGGRPRPGAEILLSAVRAPPAPRSSAEDPSSEAPPASSADSAAASRHHVLLAARQFGKGRACAYFTESDWRWALERAESGGDRLLAMLWGRMVRWLSGREDRDGSGPSIVLSRGVVRAGEEVGVSVDGVDAGAEVRVVAEGPGLLFPTRIEGESRPGGWAGRYAPLAAGVHEIRLEQERSPDASLREGRASGRVALLVEPDTRELEEVEPDWDLLRKIAEGTGGRFLTLAETGSLADGIVRDSKTSAAHVELGFERSWVLHVVIIALLTLEWILRRRIHVV